MTTARFVRRAFMTSLFLAILVPLLLYGASDTQATTFAPQYTITLADPAAGANSDILADLTLPAPQVNFALLVSFLPPQFGVAEGKDIPIGALVGELQSTATLGLINNNCLTPVFPSFNFMNASLDIADTIDPLKSGTPDRLSNIAADSDGNGIPDGADKWPSWLNNIFRTNDADPSTVIIPRARAFSEFFLASATTSVILQALVFDPGLTLDPPGPEPPITFDPALGYATVTVLQTIGDPTEAPSPGAITDFCTPLITSATAFGLTKDNPATTGADEGGLVLRTNPPEAGSYDFTNYVVSQRDADEDGHENILDPCPFTADPDWDPRTGVVPPFPAPIPGDDDRDGIPNSCDQEPNTQLGLLDRDFDGYDNRGDNCPQVENGINIITLQIQGPNNQEDRDLDGIGDECDPNPDTPDGHRHGGAGNELFVITPVTVTGGGGGTPTPTATATATPEQKKEEKKTEILEGLELGMNLDAVLDSVVIGSSTDVLAVCAEVENGLKPVSGVDITFKIDEQPGSDADLDGEAEVTITSDAEGFAEATLNAGSVTGDIVVSATAAECGTDTTTVTVTATDVAGETTGPTGGGTGAAGGADTGIGSLAPIAASIPAWAAIASGLGGAGLLGSLGALAARTLRRRRS